jgi:hypothetical protein
LNSRLVDSVAVFFVVPCILERCFYTLSKGTKPQQQVTAPKPAILKDKKANSKEDAISLVNETPISNHKVDKKYPQYLLTVAILYQLVDLFGLLSLACFLD